MQTDKFVQFLVLKGLARITIHGYVGGVRRLIEVVGSLTPTIDEVNKYIAVMYSSEYSYHYKVNTALAVEKYMEFIGNPVRFGRQRKPKTIIKNTLTEAEVTKLIFSCKSLKEKTVIALLAYSGIRNKELCGLRVRDFDPGRNTIRVIQGKGMKDGLSMISADCTRILLEFSQGKNSDDFLFKTYQRNQYTGGALRKLIKVVARRSGINKRVYPHLLRHSMACHLVQRGADMLTIKNQLRHAHFETTFLYLNSIVLGEMNKYDSVSPSYL